MWNARPLPPFMEKSILNFHFDYWKISLTVRADGADCRTIWHRTIWHQDKKMDNLAPTSSKNRQFGTAICLDNFHHNCHQKDVGVVLFAKHF